MGHEPRETPLTLTLLTKIFRWLVSVSVYSLEWIQIQIQDLDVFMRGDICVVTNKETCNPPLMFS